ncbi:caprin-1 [Nephila pilipes]|uniref:Caprin-1 n=1 Tax=Nephila pilipes TaxID=299642 RepID=A0A8X6Q9D6_NEPPI|nr:caprin-1 [Nephila pilipes]
MVENKIEKFSRVRDKLLEGNKGAVKLTEDELNSLDELYKSICPERDQESEISNDFGIALSKAAKHIQGLLDATNKEMFGTTYKGLRETLQKIYSCSYFNKFEENIPNETEATLSETKEEHKNFQEQQSSEVEDFAITQKSDDYVLQKSGGTIPHVERPYYPIENASLYPDQAHPIQEVLSGQGNLNFLQESQIEIQAPVNQQAPTSLPGATYTNVQYTPTPQSIAAANLTSQHRTRRPSEEATILQHHSPTVMGTSAPLQQQTPQPNMPLQPTTQPTDFDPGRPIPTQTYTNQSFSSVVHPMMAVPQNYVPVSLPHGISPAHVLPSNMVLPPRNAVSNPNPLPISAAHAPQQLSTDSPQSAHVPAQSYDNDIQETYQSTNNSQAYMNRENFVDSSSYSSNLKRGLTSRGGARVAPRGAGPRGGRVGYRN